MVQVAAIKQSPQPLLADSSWVCFLLGWSGGMCVCVCVRDGRNVCSADLGWEPYGSLWLEEDYNLSDLSSEDPVPASRLKPLNLQLGQEVM